MALNNMNVQRHWPPSSFTTITVFIYSLIFSSFFFQGSSAEAAAELSPAMKKVCDDVAEDPSVCSSSIIPFLNVRGLNNPNDPAGSVLAMQINAGINATGHAVRQVEHAMNQANESKPEEARRLKTCLQAYGDALQWWKKAAAALELRNGGELHDRLEAVADAIDKCEEAYTHSVPQKPTYSPHPIDVNYAYNSPFARMGWSILRMTYNAVTLTDLIFH